MKVRILDRAAFDAAAPRLADILIDAVDSGAGVSFMAPLSRADAIAFWRGIDPERERVFAAEESGIIAGTVMLQLCWQPNQPHRCEVAKLLVHREFRGQGVATALMAALEAEARRIGRSLITFDAVAGSAADAFYRRLGFACAGVIPGYAYSGQGQLDGTAIFYKAL